jgi:hypothetical protein
VFMVHATRGSVRAGATLFLERQGTVRSGFNVHVSLIGSSSIRK